MQTEWQLCHNSVVPTNAISIRTGHSHILRVGTIVIPKSIMRAQWQHEVRRSALKVVQPYLCTEWSLTVPVGREGSNNDKLELKRIDTTKFWTFVHQTMWHNDILVIWSITWGEATVHMRDLKEWTQSYLRWWHVISIPFIVFLIKNRVTGPKINEK